MFGKGKGIRLSLIPLFVIAGLVAGVMLMGESETTGGIAGRSVEVERLQGWTEYIGMLEEARAMRIMQAEIDRWNGLAEFHKGFVKVERRATSPFEVGATEADIRAEALEAAALFNGWSLDFAEEIVVPVDRFNAWSLDFEEELAEILGETEVVISDAQVMQAEIDRLNGLAGLHLGIVEVDRRATSPFAAGPPEIDLRALALEEAAKFNGWSSGYADEIIVPVDRFNAWSLDFEKEIAEVLGVPKVITTAQVASEAVARLNGFSLGLTQVPEEIIVPAVIAGEPEVITTAQIASEAVARLDGFSLDLTQLPEEIIVPGVSITAGVNREEALEAAAQFNGWSMSIFETTLPKVQQAEADRLTGLAEFYLGVGTMLPEDAKFAAEGYMQAVLNSEAGLVGVDPADRKFFANGYFELLNGISEVAGMEPVDQKFLADGYIELLLGLG